MDSLDKKIMTPGLYRGIEVLRLMEACSEAVSLKQLAEKTGYPKASLLRILDTLIQLKLVHRDQDGYHALARLAPLDQTGKRFEARLNEALETLAEKTQTSAEWYVPSEQGMVLTICRQAGQAEVVVRARPGFLRDWNGELDSVAMLGYGFNDRAPKINGSLWVYDAFGEHRLLDVGEACGMIENARSTGLAEDIIANPYGVLRMAGAVFSRQTFLGVVSLAMPKTPQFDSMKSQRREALQHVIQNLSDPQQKE